ncbi:MAG: DUF4340 domain-containing protein [Planctomycetota bacterium]
MNTRSLTILGIVTALVAVLAIVTLQKRERAVEATPTGQKLFPALTAKINDAAEIEVKRQDGVTTLKKAGETWGLAEKNGYPVDMAAVRKCLIGMTQMTTAEEKTADPALYAKLGVEDPAAEGATSTLVTVRDASGATLAALIVGKERTGKGQGNVRQVYARKSDEARSWLVNGDLGLPEEGTDWLEKKILEIKRERIRAVEVKHADGQVVLVDRDKPETDNFTLHDIPEGKELSYPSAPGSLGGALEWLNLEDVKPAGEMDVKDGATATAKFSCFDGLTVTVTTKNVEDRTYARFEASYEAPPEIPGPPTPAAEPDAEKTEGAETADTPEMAAGADKKSREEVEKEAAELNARLGAWTFVVPSYNKSSFQKVKSELLKDKAPPPVAPPESSMPEETTTPAPPEPQGSEGTPPKEEKTLEPELEPKPPGFENS